MELPDLNELQHRVIFEIAGTNAPAQLAVEGPFSDSGGPFYLVSLAYRRLSAAWPVGNLDPARFLAFFGELALERHGWKGQKRVATADGDFSLACAFQSQHLRPEVWLTVRLATDFADPSWTAELRLELAPESLTDLAARARSFFAKSS